MFAARCQRYPAAAGRACEGLASGRMSSRERHEAVWAGLPPGLAPADFSLRRGFLLAHVSPGASVLDVGCGEGAFASELAHAGARVVGVEVAEEPLRRARARDPGLDLRLISGEGPWELPDAAFDVVWAGEVIEHVAETAAWLSEARRVLRSGGSLLLSTPAHGALVRLRLAALGRGWAEHFDPLGDHLRFYTAASLSRLLLEFRFEQVQIRSAGGPPGLRRLLLARAVRSRF
jgi:2-polyprenyl-3-methyl-5-hydroxy-6-metoxy-1,4-benzoquinol methylase